MWKYELEIFDPITPYQHCDIDFHCLMMVMFANNHFDRSQTTRVREQALDVNVIIDSKYLCVHNASSRNNWVKSRFYIGNAPVNEVAESTLYFDDRYIIASERLTLDQVKF